MDKAKFEELVLSVASNPSRALLDTLAAELKKNIPDEGMRLDIDILGFKLGSMIFHRADVETLRTYIVNA